MFKSFQVKNFRCFKDLTIGPLERVNLIAGKNNVGKSALLEALLLFHRYDSPAEAVLITRRRGLFGLSSKDYVESLFHGFNVRQDIQMEAEKSSTSKRVLSMGIGESSSSTIPSDLGREVVESKGEFSGRVADRYIPTYAITYVNQLNDGKKTKYVAKVNADGVISQTRAEHLELPPCVFVLSRQMGDQSHLAEALSELTERKETELLIEALQVIEPRLVELRILQKGKYAVIYADTQGSERLMPVALLGEGMSRLLSVVLGVASARQGLLLVDEIENGLHYSVMTKVWKAIASAARTFDVQVFATTHSDECIRAAHEAFSEGDTYDFRLHRLDSIKGEIESVTYDQDTLAFALEQGWEVR